MRAILFSYGCYKYIENENLDYSLDIMADAVTQKTNDRIFLSYQINNIVSGISRTLGSEQECISFLEYRRRIIEDTKEIDKTKIEKECNETLEELINCL